jgi:4-amino-4-deoxy-L-arabinose transferase-like glycosyltransferase
MQNQNRVKQLQIWLTSHRWLALILVIAFLLRLVFALVQNQTSPYDQGGGDTWWYLDHGYKLVIGTIAGPPPSAPLYLIATGIAQTVFGAESAGAMLFLRLAQVLMGTTTCYFAYRLATAVSGDERPGLLAGSALAVSPVFIIESAQPLTETLYIFLVSGGLLAYVELVKNQARRGYAGTVLVALLLGLATLTRAVLLAFPLGLAFHLLLVYGWRRGIRLAVVLITVYSLVCSIWTIYNLVRWDYPVIGAQGLSAFLFIGAEGWKPPDQIDQTLAEGAEGQLPTNPEDQQQLYQNAAAQSIMSDIPGWLARRANALLGAVVQPHGTTFFPGEGLKELTGNWWTHDRTIGGLLRLTGAEQFWPKMAIYMFYYVGLIGGAAGLLINRRKWRVVLPLAGFILYTLLIHFVLDALPRYLFPLNVIWWVFAGTALTVMWDRIRAKLPNHRAVMMHPRDEML